MYITRKRDSPNNIKDFLLTFEKKNVTPKRVCCNSIRTSMIKIAKRKQQAISKHYKLK